ncbi:MAG: Do family serine endopeptidase [Bryobacteraceae bacterium]|jgi:serine protease Do
MSIFDKLRTQKFLSFTLVLFTLSIGIVIGTLINSGVKAAKDNQAAPGATPLVIPNPVELSSTFTQIAKQVEPSVVNISTTYLPKAQTRSTPRGGKRQVTPPDDQDQGDNSGMEEFFRFFGNPFGNGIPEMPQRRGAALGSGVVVDQAGYILTNNHVVDKADRIQVKFTGDPTQYEAKVVGVDVPTDLAVIRVEGKKNMVPAKIGNSDAVQVGDWAVAIGSPFGLQATVTAGIISAKERDIAESQFQHFLQTDAAINPGNSGGPLLNIRGEVIGINTAIATLTRSYQGVGFAMPMNMAAQVYNQIIKNGKVTRGGIGVKITQSDTDRARALLKDAGVSEGAFVEEVTAGGGSDKAGIKAEDVIVAVNGKPVRTNNDLIDTVTATPVGSSLDIAVVRDHKRQNFRVVVGDLAQLFPEQFGTGNEQESNKAEGSAMSLGMHLENLTDQRRETLGLKEKGGVRVYSVEPDSFAEDIGLLAGDVLLSINHQPVNTVVDVTRVRDTLKPGDQVTFRVLRKARGPNGEWAQAFAAGFLPNTR